MPALSILGFAGPAAAGPAAAVLAAAGPAASGPVLGLHITATGPIMQPVFWLESVALFAFGVSWLIKDKAIQDLLSPIKNPTANPADIHRGLCNGSQILAHVFGKAAFEWLCAVNLKP